MKALVDYLQAYECAVAQSIESELNAVGFDTHRESNAVNANQGARRVKCVVTIGAVSRWPNVSTRVWGLLMVVSSLNEDPTYTMPKEFDEYFSRDASISEIVKQVVTWSNL